MFFHNGLDCRHEVLDVFRVTLCYLGIGPDEAARDIVDVLEGALELGVEIEADWAGCHFPKRFGLVRQVRGKLSARIAEFYLPRGAVYGSYRRGGR